MIELVHEFSLLPNIPVCSNCAPSNTMNPFAHPPKPVANIFSKTSVFQKPAQSVEPIRTFHLAEGPGGFIEAVANLRKNPDDEYVGMTILDDKNDRNIPAWKKSDFFLYSNPNVRIEKGADGTGDILSLANFEYCAKTYASSMHFITADGGFDFSTDFNKQEIHIARLLFAQIAFALVMQMKNGHFVLKIFDCFYADTIDLMAILSAFYRTVYITKPQTSRIANSEKYVVCKGFLYDSIEEFYPYLLAAFRKMSESPVDLFVHRFLNIELPLYFTVKIEEYNATFGQQQIENIHTTLSLIDKPVKPDRIDALIKSNVLKCVNWCMRYNVPYNVFTPTNAFK
jgi:23S rRNA U2552 (ribose-2'-O)-methylase RlmE/FtsJ